MRSEMPFDLLQDADWDRFHLLERTTPTMITPLPAETPVAMAYVPYQQWDTMYTAEEGFPYGTIFPQLHKPFCVGGDDDA
jgi:hypothetical protein